MEILENHDNGALVAVLSGKLDTENLPVFEQWLYEREDAGEERLVLNLGGLTYICSGGLRCILSAAKQLRNRRGLAICGLYGLVAEVFHVSGFMEILEIHPDVESALSEGVSA